MRKLIQAFAAPTPQTEPMAGVKTRQVRNSAGGYSWAVDDRVRLERFLVLGSSQGSYYASPQKLTRENAEAVLRYMAYDGPRAVEIIAATSQAGRAPRNDPAIFALGLCLKLGDPATRAAAAAAVPRVCRTGTHLFQLASVVEALGGWGRGTRRAFARWYGREDVAGLALQAVKYRQREGWSHRDLLRLAHPAPPTAEHNALYRWICRGGQAAEVAPEGALGMLWAADQAQTASEAELLALIEAYALLREVLPTEALNRASVWEALLFAGAGMPMTAMLRNLAKMTAVGLLAPGSAAVDRVVARLADREALRRARIHPLSVLVALNTYRRGKGVRGSLTWSPVKPILDALDQAFDLSFASIEPAGVRWLLAVDVSGSMTCGEVAGMTGITPRVGSAAMAMVTARTEKRHEVLAFSDKLVPVDVSARMRLDDVQAAFARIPMGGTDCALPMQHALRRKLEVDVFVVYTDSETWHGKEHPVQALRRYRQATGIPAKLIVVGMVSNGFTIADPDDAGMMDVVGFDAAAPAVMADFARPRACA